MELLDYVLKWVNEEKIEIKREEEGIVFSVNGDNGSWYARVSVMEEEQILFIVTAYPFQVPERMRTKAVVALGNITSKLKMGAFYMDMEDGQINFRLSQKISLGEESEIWMKELIMLAMKVTDAYFRDMMKLAIEG